MTTRQVEEGKIFLNGTLFSLVPTDGHSGKVRTRIATPQRTLRRIGWTSHRRGMGTNRIGPEGPFDVCHDTSWDIRHPGHLTLPGVHVETNPTLNAAGGSGITLVGELDGLLVSTAGSTIFSFVDSSVWTQRDSSVPAAPVDIKNGNLGGTEYLVIPYASGYTYADAIATWADKTVNVVNVEFHDGKLFGIDATGQCWFNLTIAGTVENVAKINLSHGEVVTGLFRARTKGENNAFIIYAVTSKKLYALNFGQNKFDEISDISLGDNNELAHERPAVVYKGKIYLASGRSIIEWDPVNLTIDHIGFDLGDGMPAGSDGRITCLAANATELFVGTKAVLSGTDDAVVMAWDGVGWRRIWSEPTNTEVVDSMHVARVPNTAMTAGQGGDVEYLFIGTTSKVYQVLINNSQTRPSKINGWVAMDEGINPFPRHQLPIYSDPNNTTVALRLKVQVAGASATVGLIVDVAFDQAAYTKMTNPEFTVDSIFDATDDRVEAAGTVTFSFPSGQNDQSGKEFTDIQIAVRQSTSTATKALDVYSIVLEYLEVQDYKDGFEFELDFREEGELPIQELRAAFVVAKKLSTLFELSFRDDTGNTRNLFVTIRAAEGDEGTGYDEEGTMRVIAEAI